MSQNFDSDDANSPVEMPGRTIGDYVVLRRLGSGGMADVYLAEQQSLKRKVALKILKSELGKDEAYVKRFFREAQAAAALVQANIVQIYEVGQHRGIYFIAQEYIPGRNLKQFISRHGAVDPVMAVTVLRQSALALQRAAEQGVIHRDIKPENIMLSTSGEVKITDFGLARLTDQASRVDLTQLGVTMGTPLYMSPEQVEGRHVDSRADIYSLGITAYHMLAGHPPFEGENALAVALQHVNKIPPSLATIRPDVPAELIWIIEKMMAKAPEDRIQSAAQLLKELRKVKIELDDNWDRLVERLATTDSGVENGVASHTSRLAVTRQLQAVMVETRPGWWQVHGRIVLLAALLSLVGAGTGWALAWNKPLPNPLAQAEQIKFHVPRKSSAEEQYRAAQWVGLPEFYAAVLENFPAEQAEPDRRNSTLLFNRLAMQRLAEYYLQRFDYNQAYKYFAELANVEDSAVEFRASGYAGLAVVNEALGNHIEARLCFLEAYQHYERLNEYLRSLLDVLAEDFTRTPPAGEIKPGAAPRDGRPAANRLQRLLSRV